MNRALDTERLHLRPFTAADHAGWHAIWGDPEVIWWGADPDPETSRRRLEGLLRQEAEVWPAGIGWLAVQERGGAEIVGDVLLQPARFVEGIEVGWHVRRHSWGRGYATEAARATVSRALREGACDAVYALIEVDNRPSLRVAEKLGMRPVREMDHEGLPHRLFVLRGAPV